MWCFDGKRTMAVDTRWQGVAWAHRLRISVGVRLIGAVCLAAVPCAQAQEIQTPSPVASPEAQAPSVESAQVAVRSAAEWLASGVDSWFGNRPFSDGGQVSDGQIGLDLYSRQDQASTASVRFNARFVLPNLESHTYFFTGRDNAVGLLTDRPAAFDTHQQLLQSDSALDKTFFAGLGRSLSDSVDARIGFQGGLKPFAQGRYRKLWQTSDTSDMEFSQTVFLTAQDHVGSSTLFSYQQHFGPTWVGRWLNSVTATQADPNAEWNGSLGAYHTMGPQQLLSLELLATAKQNSGVALTDYGLQARWEQPVNHDKLIGELIVGHFWPHSLIEGARTTAWALGAGLKMRF